MSDLLHEWLAKAEQDYHSAWRDYRARKFPNAELNPEFLRYSRRKRLHSPGHRVVAENPMVYSKTLRLSFQPPASETPTASNLSAS
jgi:hypothetical protein